jgi:hypothetical protein
MYGQVAEISYTKEEKTIGKNQHIILYWKNPGYEL